MLRCGTILLRLRRHETHWPVAADFDSFWANTLAEARAFPLDAKFEHVDYGLVAQETFDVTFNGFGGQPVKGWLILPAQRKAPLPVVVEYIG